MAAKKSKKLTLAPKPRTLLKRVQDSSLDADTWSEVVTLVESVKELQKGVKAIKKSFKEIRRPIKSAPAFRDAVSSLNAEVYEVRSLADAIGDQASLLMSKVRTVEGDLDVLDSSIEFEPEEDEAPASASNPATALGHE